MAPAKTVVVLNNYFFAHYVVHKSSPWGWVIVSYATELTQIFAPDSFNCFTMVLKKHVGVNLKTKLKMYYDPSIFSMCLFLLVNVVVNASATKDNDILAQRFTGWFCLLCLCSRLYDSLIQTQSRCSTAFGALTFVFLFVATSSIIAAPRRLCVAPLLESTTRLWAEFPSLLFSTTCSSLAPFSTAPLLLRMF